MRLEILAYIDLSKIEWADNCLKYKSIKLKHIKKPWFWGWYEKVQDNKYLEKLFKKIFELHINSKYKGVFKIK